MTSMLVQIKMCISGNHVTNFAEIFENFQLECLAVKLF